MTKPEPSIFDQADDEADEVAMREGEADAGAGRVIPHAEFSAWLETWGTPGEKPPPKSWFK
jgi:predicted transcriptional regulator